MASEEEEEEAAVIGGGGGGGGNNVFIGKGAREEIIMICVDWKIGRIYEGVFCVDC